MEASLSPNTVVALASLQTRNYIYVSIAAFWIYGYCLKWSAEYTYVFYTPRGSFKFLYLIARYSPFFLLGFHLCLNLLPNESAGTCNFLDSVCSIFTALSVISAESIFISRTWALWGRSKKILRLILVPFALIIAFNIVVSVGIEQPSQIAAVPPAARGSLTGCYTLHHDNWQIIPFAMIVVFELEVLLLTCIRVIKVYRERMGGLVQIIFQHNVFYFFCGLVLSCINVFAILLLKASSCFRSFQIVMHSVLATNMHLALWSGVGIELDTPRVFEMTTLMQVEFVTPTALTER
ncbi:hypothetical protein PAXRUDRAFT_138399 [Paxillus rubicundulus Ve08.2h10]|uniref:DUF6533 domain-containing protein n=1 Tax=Paxillus rubicundulus Ve08.2h10 TaxID=930991 RepID=A0A0D0E591_9AGAM|nr:hypothetical protein PAXRUDRAFT_138399 [Paxillus rubicundulus Ve08.2h10]